MASVDKIYLCKVCGGSDYNSNAAWELEPIVESELEANVYRIICKKCAPLVKCHYLCKECGFTTYNSSEVNGDDDTIRPNPKSIIPTHIITCKRCTDFIYECKFCHKMFENDSYSAAARKFIPEKYCSSTTYYFACNDCTEKEYCSGCGVVIVVKDHAVKAARHRVFAPKCSKCRDFAAKFWAEELPGALVPGFQIEIKLETETYDYCKGKCKPDLSVRPKVKTETLRFPINTSFHPNFFSGYEMSFMFKKIIQPEDVVTMSGCGCHPTGVWSWDVCRRVQKIVSCKLVQPQTPGEQILKFLDCNKTSNSNGQ